MTRRADIETVGERFAADLFVHRAPCRPGRAPLVPTRDPAGHFLEIGERHAARDKSRRPCAQRDFNALVFRCFCSVGHQSAFAPDALTTFARRSTSFLMKASNCAVVIGCGVAPCVSMRSFTSGKARMATASLLSFSLISFGNLPGPTSPVHRLN